MLRDEKQSRSIQTPETIYTFSLLNLGSVFIGIGHGTYHDRITCTGTAQDTTRTKSTLVSYTNPYLQAVSKSFQYVYLNDDGLAIYNYLIYYWERLISPMNIRPLFSLFGNMFCQFRQSGFQHMLHLMISVSSRL